MSTVATTTTGTAKKATKNAPAPKPKMRRYNPDKEKLDKLRHAMVQAERLLETMEFLDQWFGSLYRMDAREKRRAFRAWNRAFNRVARSRAHLEHEIAMRSRT
ncbi:unnamed protein product [Gemmata massiliana]|uniref:Uncharacterized protein n=1 Tax=Gemmata massiliana TaxID=1210884 RepID=A0A6P2CQI8_9BACT|nr:hypothetical protein [Gemmata massiliana]VTR90837.1 unnamed protein product [Gemmata massiliana]